MTVAATPIVTSAASAAAFIRATWNGRNGAGSVSVPGLAVGDVMIWFGFTPDADVLHVTEPGQLGFFEGVISVADEIQQTSTSDFSSGITFTGILLRGV